MTAEQLEERVSELAERMRIAYGGQLAKDCTETIKYLARRVIAAEKLVEALEVTRHMVAESSRTGFNHKDGDWADRLYANNANIHATLTEYREASK